MVGRETGEGSDGRRSGGIVVHDATEFTLPSGDVYGADRVGDKWRLYVVVNAYGHDTRIAKGKVVPRKGKFANFDSAAEAKAYARRYQLTTVARELGHGSEAMVRRVYAHLGEVRHRSEAVEYRVAQHMDQIGDRLQKLGIVTGNVTAPAAGVDEATPRDHRSDDGAEVLIHGPG